MADVVERYNVVPYDEDGNPVDTEDLGEEYYE